MPVNPARDMSGQASNQHHHMSLIHHHLHHHNHHDESSSPMQQLPTLIVEINSQLALFRDLLIHIGQPRDCPELRERVRRLRRACVEACKHSTQLILPNMKRDEALLLIAVYNLSVPMRNPP